MATTSPSSRIRRIASRRKSPAYEFPPIFNQFRGLPTVDGMQTPQTLRRRRSSRSRVTEGRSRSVSRPRASRGALGIISNFFRCICTVLARYILPLASWLLVLGSLYLSIATIFSVVSFVADSAERSIGVSRFYGLNSWTPIWVGEVTWPSRYNDGHTIDTDGSVESFFDTHPGMESSRSLGLPATQIDLAKDAAEQTWAVIERVLHQVDRIEVTSSRGDDVASLTRELAKAHRTSGKLFQSLLVQDSAFRRRMLSRVRELAQLVTQYEYELVNSSSWQQGYAWMPFLFQGSPVGVITRELERFARDQTAHANELAETAQRVRGALRKESNIRDNLKITLPLNWRELGEGLEFEELQDFLQHGADVWLQNASKVADAFRRQYRQLSDQYLDTFTTLREKLRSGKDRAALVKFIQANVDGIKRSLAESERALVTRSED